MTRKRSKGNGLSRVEPFDRTLNQPSLSEKAALAMLSELYHKNMIPCFLCSHNFQYGPHLYNGKYIPVYKMSVCMTCYKANYDGWSPIYEAKILNHLKKEGMAVPKRQRDGYLPRDGYPA